MLNAFGLPSSELNTLLIGDLDNTETTASPLPERTHGLLLSTYCIQNIVATLGRPA